MTHSESTGHHSCNPREREHLARSGLTADQCGKVQERVAECLNILGRHQGRSIPMPEIRFDLSGTSAGQYQNRRLGAFRKIHVLRFNPYLLARHFEDGLRSTVPHEVAHYAVALSSSRRKLRPHGPEWQEVMRRLGAGAAVTHSYALDGLPVRRQLRWLYRCGCRQHEVSTTRHHRIQKGMDYRCLNCRQSLVPVEPEQQETNT